MALMMVCDACGKEMHPTDRTQVILSSDQNMAGASVDLCGTCSAGIRSNAQLKKGKDNFLARMNRPAGGDNAQTP